MANSKRTSRGPVPGRGPAVEKHWSKQINDCLLFIVQPMDQMLYNQLTAWKYGKQSWYRYTHMTSS